MKKMKIGIYGQFYHDDSDVSIQLLLGALYDKNSAIYIEENFLKLIIQHKDINDKYSDFPTFKELDASFDLFLSIGGDGTILKNHVEK